jgi:hypothetical protein
LPSDGSYLVEGKTVTGFANVEEDFSDAAEGQTIMPYCIESELRRRAPTIPGRIVRELRRARHEPHYRPVAVLRRQGSPTWASRRSETSHGHQRSVVAPGRVALLHCDPAGVIVVLMVIRSDREVRRPDRALRALGLDMTMFPRRRAPAC